jgi:hypothetical protein
VLASSERQHPHVANVWDEHFRIDAVVLASGELAAHATKVVAESIEARWGAVTEGARLFWVPADIRVGVVGTAAIVTAPAIIAAAGVAVATSATAVAAATTATATASTAAGTSAAL